MIFGTGKDAEAAETPAQDTATTESTQTEVSSLNNVGTPNSSNNLSDVSANLGIDETTTVEALQSSGLDSEHATESEILAALLNEQSREKQTYSIQALSVPTTASNRNYEATTLMAATLTDTAQQGDNNQIISADELANGYIQSQTDATNASNTLSGRAWIVDTGTPATMSNGLTPVPEGTNVYLQWKNKDGAVSPIYVAQTTNQLSNSDGSQVGPGAYAFDLRDGWVDANGQEHIYNATSGQSYRLYIEDFQTENGNTASMMRQAGGFFPGSYVDSVTNSNLGQFPLIGTNMQRTGIYMAIQPSNDYMTTDQTTWIHDTEGSLSNPSVSLSAENTVSGKVRLESGSGDNANSATGPNYNPGGSDVAAKQYTVVMSSLTNEGVQAYEEQVNSLPENERASAVKTLLTNHPEYISATVYGETDENGNYTLRFLEGTLNDDYLYGYVIDQDGEIQTAYSSYTSPEFRRPNSNLSFTPQTAPAQNLIMNPMWYNVNFAVIPTTDAKIDITNFNNTKNPALLGDTAQIDLSGTKLSPLPTHIEWVDSLGNIVK
ncbi:hypothetical protein ACUW90_002375 [Staphylococcus simulans]|uniref:hypothetical protein n=3 Tax=Staphylococcus TaxID=1279 RepID=UPI0030C3E0BB